MGILWKYIIHVQHAFSRLSGSRNRRMGMLDGNQKGPNRGNLRPAHKRRSRNAAVSTLTFFCCSQAPSRSDGRHPAVFLDFERRRISSIARWRQIL